MGNAEGRGEDGDELNDEFFESPLKINVHSSGKGDQYTKSSSKDGKRFRRFFFGFRISQKVSLNSYTHTTDIVKVNVPINSTLSVGFRLSWKKKKNAVSHAANINRTWD